jgi:hypothetical protein
MFRRKKHLRFNLLSDCAVFLLAFQIPGMNPGVIKI